MLFLLVHAVVLLRLVMIETGNGSSAVLISWVSVISKSTFAISLDDRGISGNVEQVGSSTHLINVEKVDDAFSLVVIFWSEMLVPSSIFSFWVVNLFLKLEL